MEPRGDKIQSVELASGKVLNLHKVSLEDESFHEQSYWMQTILPFFIDGASVIEPCPFWKYFILYDSETNEIVAFATVYEAHQTAEKFRAKVS